MANRSATTSRRGSKQAKKASTVKRAAKARVAKTDRERGIKQAKQGREWAGKNVATFRDALSKGILAPLNLVMLTRDRIQEVVDDAVTRGRMTRRDANDLVQGLVRCGTKETEDVLSDLERLLGRSTGDLEEVTTTARRRATQAATRARQRIERTGLKARRGTTRAADTALAKAGRARDVATARARLPISGYDGLTAAQIQARLEGLTPAELRKVRDYEKRKANRKTVLTAIEVKLS